MELFILVEAFVNTISNSTCKSLQVELKIKLTYNQTTGNIFVLPILKHDFKSDKKYTCTSKFT